jgi:tetratricopeptide (TPR) repeat protein
LNVRLLFTFALTFSTFPLLPLLPLSQSSLDAQAQLDLANRLYGDARYQQALDAYDLALATGDSDIATRARKGKVRAALRVAEFEIARREADTLVAAAGTDAEARTLHGDALWATGFFDEADTAYRAALDAVPGSSRARFGLARSLATRNRLDDALAATRIATDAAPGDPEVQALLGQIHERLGRFDEAADAYERYAALLPNQEDTMAVVFLARVQLLRSFQGREPLLIDARTAGREHRIRFKLVNKKIVLQGRLNNTPVEFVLDTGAERTGISRATARRAGVAAVTTTLTAGVGLGSVRRLDLGRADRIEIGSLVIRNVPVAIRNPAPNAMPRWQAESFSPIALGLSMVVDYDRRELVLARSLTESPASVRLAMRVNRLPMVRGLLNSTRPAYFVVDTGGELISISAETATSLAMTPVRRIPLRVYGLSGWDRDAFLLPGVDLNFDQLEYRKVGLAVLNLRAPSVLLGFQLGGIVGHEFLSDYRVAMDLEKSELRLSRN